MEYITISTKKCEERLGALSSETPGAAVFRADGSLCAAIPKENLNKAAFFRMLKEAALDCNAVVRNSPKLRKFIASATPKSMTVRMERALDAYLRENETMNIEGYIRFRMFEFTGHVDFLLYRLVKQTRERR